MGAFGLESFRVWGFIGVSSGNCRSRFAALNAVLWSDCRAAYRMFKTIQTVGAWVITNTSTIFEVSDTAATLGLIFSNYSGR